VLSVAGFSAVTGLFPGREALFLKCKEVFLPPARVGGFTFLTELGILILEHSYVLGFSTIPNIAQHPGYSPRNRH